MVDWWESFIHCPRSGCGRTLVAGRSIVLAGAMYDESTCSNGHRWIRNVRLINNGLQSEFIREAVVEYLQAQDLPYESQLELLPAMGVCA